MPRPRRRPSAAIVISLLALFVALGGPAEAKRLINGKLLKKGSVTSRAIDNHTVRTRDLRHKTVRKLRRPPAGSVTEAKLANGAVTPGKLAPGAVGAAAIADRSVGPVDLAPGAVGGATVADGSLTGADIADGSLAARDLARFWGNFTVVVGAKPDGSQADIPAGSCWSAEPKGLAPERAGADISTDVVLITPGFVPPQPAMSFTVRHSALPSRFVIVACNVDARGAPFPPTTVRIDYMVIRGA